MKPEYKSQFFTIPSVILADGCHSVDPSAIVRYAKRCAEKVAGFDRARLDRFSVKVDGECYRYSQAKSLHKCLLGIKDGAECKVFRNAMGGATIDFDFQYA